VDESVDGHTLAVIDAVGQYIDQSTNLDSVIYGLRKPEVSRMLFWRASLSLQLWQPG